jgi:hypothetical protein
MVKGWRSNRGYMFAMMLAMLALMAVMGVGLSRLMMTTKATTQMQRTQDNKQLMNSLVITLSSKAADSDGDFVLEPPAFSTAVVTGLTAPTNGGFVGTDVANTDAWGRRLGYCAYDYGSATATAPSGKSLFRGSTASSPTDSWVAVVVISAGPDGVINTPCPAVDTAASSVVATGDDMVAARSYGEMVSFGNAQIASSLSGMGTNSTNKLCRLNDSGKMVCDVVVDACTVYQASKWNATSFKFDCINFKPADCSNGRQHSENWSNSCPSGQTGTLNYQCLNGVTSQTSGACYANCGGQTHGSTWTASCPSGQTGNISYQCSNGSPRETGRSCVTPPAACSSGGNSYGHGLTWSVSCPSPQSGNITYQCNNGSPAQIAKNCQICTATSNSISKNWASNEISHRNVGSCQQTGDTANCDNTCNQNKPSDTTVSYCESWHCAPFMFGGRTNVCKCFNCVGTQTISTTSCTPVP